MAIGASKGEERCCRCTKGKTTGEARGGNIEGTGAKQGAQLAGDVGPERGSGEGISREEPSKPGREESGQGDLGARPVGGRVESREEEEAPGLLETGPEPTLALKTSLGRKLG
jgi:hypothetical protein